MAFEKKLYYVTKDGKPFADKNEEANELIEQSEKLIMDWSSDKKPIIIQRLKRR
jgi:hypothetical protein